MPDDIAPATVEQTIGDTLRELRDAANVSARQLSLASGVSSAMISRIESGQVSPSIATLTSLSDALGVPLVRLFHNAGPHCGDYTLVRAEEGAQSRRVVEGHTHDYKNLAVHVRRDLQFEARTVTVKRQDAAPPRYVGRGVVFVQILSGEARYQCGGDTVTLRAGDALTTDAELRHGFVELLSDELVFLTVQAERQR